MLDMSGAGDFIKDFLEISVLPFAISYQLEPCDFLKARELYITRRGQYVKKPGEDTHSILTGVTQDKGGIAFHFCPALTEGGTANAAQYTPEARAAFTERMEKGLSSIVEKDPDMDKDELKEIFLSIYANPVRSVRAHQAGDRGSSCPA